ncbi:High mobility group box domain [Arabidopsis suecica]|uniref:High mobility group box domain n=1 Tax=Arabidopsis suecica TaxID=45249 RepID=A0A8T2BAZ9_ARASU|nr:High mobility group box domain [Arabidopsis suecica]
MRCITADEELEYLDVGAFVKSRKRKISLFEDKRNHTFACGQPSLTQAEQEKANKKKKKDCPETKRPSSSYVLWCKDQWAEVKKQNPEADFKEKEAMKLLEDDQKQKTAMELLDQYLNFVQEAEQDNKKKNNQNIPYLPSWFIQMRGENKETYLQSNGGIQEDEGRRSPEYKWRTASGEAKRRKAVEKASSML